MLLFLPFADISKSYGTLKAVDALSFTVRKGETFGLLGPNGAGKTTTISMMVGALKPDSGVIRVYGDADPSRPSVRMKIGFAPQSLSLYKELSAEKNLYLFGKLYGLKGSELDKRVDWALEFAGLADRRKDAVGGFSGGMKRRLNLVTSLLHKPEVIFLDEPMVGVDPQSRNHMFENIESLRKNGHTIIYTTHYMEEAERLCDRIGIVDSGKMLALGTLEELVNEYGGKSILTVELKNAIAPDNFPNARVEDKKVCIETHNPLEDLARIIACGGEPVSMRLDRPDLEKVFLNITGKTLRD